MAPRRDLWDMATQIGRVEAILHSIILQRQGHVLVRLLEDDTIPFQLLYNRGCRMWMDPPRLQEIFVEGRRNWHSQLLHADCLQESSQITLTAKECRFLDSSPLEASSRLPQLTAGGFDFVMRKALVYGRLPQPSCKWLLRLSREAMGRLEAIPDSWHFVHSECYGWASESDEPRLTSARLELYYHLLASLPLNSPIDTLRWTIQFGLVSLSIFRPGHDADLIDSYWLQQEITQIFMRIDEALIKPELPSQGMIRLLLSRSLLGHLTHWIFFYQHHSANRSAEHMPPFIEVWEAIDGYGTLSQLEEGFEWHWRTSLIALYLTLHPKLIGDLESRMEMLLAKQNVLWPMDVALITRLQLEPLSYSLINQGAALVSFLKRAARSNVQVQELVHTKMARSRGRHVTMQHKFIYQSIPVTKRLYIMRRVWIQNGSGVRAIASLVSLLQVRDKEAARLVQQHPAIWPVLFFMSLKANERLVQADKTGIWRLTFQTAKRMKLFAYACAMAIIYGIYFPYPYDPESLTVILDLDGTGTDIINSSEEYFDRILPNPSSAKQPRPRPRRAVLDWDARITAVASAQRKFSELLPLIKGFSKDEIIGILEHRLL